MGTLARIDPSTGETFAEVEEDSTSVVADKVARARAAQPAWAARPLAERIEVLRRFRDALVAEKEALARTLTREVGKPIAQSRNEIGATPARVDFFLEHVARAIEPETVLAAEELTERISYEPLGVVANVSAWNYPWFVGTNVIVPALLTGNAVLYKPSEFALDTGAALAAALHAAGVPRDVFQVVVGGGAVGATLLERELDAACFTGSVATGRRIAEAAARRLMKVQLELGGKDPSYVADDAPVDAAAASLADGAFYNTGQSCCSVERIYVHERIHDAFVERFAAEVRGFVVGDPTDDATYIGPLTRGAQIAVLEAQVADAVARGAKLALGGARIDRAGQWFAPTVLANVDHSMAVMRDESFGPIIGIQKVGGDEEALRLMNDTDYGLTAGVYTADRERAARLLARVDAGSVYWNCCDRVSPRLPWSGRRHSGLGVTLSTLGIRALVQPKAWHLRG